MLCTIRRAIASCSRRRAATRWRGSSSDPSALRGEMLFKRTPKLSKSQMLSARPTRLSDQPPERVGEGKWHLKAPLRPSRIAGWILRVPKDASKTFELDALGLFVWEACDGKSAVRQIIRKLARRYNLNEREAEVSTVQFLYTLAKKGLIGMS